MKTKKGFASMFIIYSFLMIFIFMMLTTLMINNYKKNFLNKIKVEVKENLKDYSLK